LRDERPPDRTYRVLFLCTGNSARSIMAECALNRCGRPRFEAFSAGSHPKGAVHPLALRLLQRFNYRTDHLRSKSWDEFAGPDALPLHFVFTVCDQAAGEVCPIWPGQPITAHWGVEDPAAFVGPIEKQERLFRDVYLQLERRIQIFTHLPIASLDRLSLQRRLDEIGRTAAEHSAVS
jgi:protein-tyrosine-phosphatase